MSPTNVARGGKRGNICVGNNVSSFARAFTWQIGARRTNDDQEFCYRYDYQPYRVSISLPLPWSILMQTDFLLKQMATQT